MTDQPARPGADRPAARVMAPLVTRTSLGEQLRALGLGWGNVVLLHTSLRSLGYVCGGPVAVVQAVLDVLGQHGTLVVPTQTGDNSDPSEWSNPPVPAQWWPAIRDETPGFHPRITPSRHMGAVPEVVRTWPGARRSDHPQVSFAAVGDRAEEMTARHRPATGLGDDSPLGRLAAAKARVLLLGAGYHACTAFHLAEYRAPGAASMTDHGAAVQNDGNRRWVTWRDLRHDADDFATIGSAYELTGDVTVGKVGAATARLFPLAEAVVFAERWMRTHRTPA